MSDAKSYIKLMRKMQKWEWYKDSVTKSLFLHLLLKANWKDGEWQGIKVKRGQLVTGRKALAFETGIKESTIERHLKRLQKSGEVGQQTNNKFRVITVCKYNDYQAVECEVEQQIEQQLTQQLTQQVDTIEEVKEVKKTTNSKKFNPLDSKPDSIDEKDWQDLITHRKAVKATSSERAYQAIINQIEIAVRNGFSPKECIDEICNRSWRGFKAEWLHRNVYRRI